MTKTLTSFKSLMLQTMSNMTHQQDNNLQTQYTHGLNNQHFKQGHTQLSNKTTDHNISSIMGA